LLSLTLRMRCLFDYEDDSPVYYLRRSFGNKVEGDGGGRQAERDRRRRWTFWRFKLEEILTSMVDHKLVPNVKAFVQECEQDLNAASTLVKNTWPLDLSGEEKQKLREEVETSLVDL